MGCVSVLSHGTATPFFISQNAISPFFPFGPAMCCKVLRAPTARVDARFFLPRQRCSRRRWLGLHARPERSCGAHVPLLGHAPSKCRRHATDRPRATRLPGRTSSSEAACPKVLAGTSDQPPEPDPPTPAAAPAFANGSAQPDHLKVNIAVAVRRPPNLARPLIIRP